MVEASKSTRAAAEAAVDAKLGGTSKSEEGFKSGGDLKSENICKTAAANEAQGAPEASGQRPSSVPEEHSKSGVRPKTADRKKRKRRSWLSSGKRARRRRGEGSQGPNAAPSQGSAEDSSESESDTSSAVQTAQTAPSAAQHLRQLPPPTASEKFLPSRSLVPCQWQLYRHLKACDDRAELLAERFVIQAVDALNALLRRLRGQSLAEASDECKKEQSLSAARSRTARLLRRFQKDFGDRKTAVWELQGLSLSSCLRRLFVFVFEEALECLLYAQGFSGFQRLSDISVLAIKHLGLSERRLRPLISFLLATAPEASAAREKAWTDWCSLRVLRGLIPLDHYDILADFWRNAQQQLDRRPEASSRRRRDRTRGGQEESDGSASEESENFRKNKKPEAEDAEATPLAQVTLPGESRASALWGSDSCFFLDEFKRRSDELRREVLESPNFFLLLRFLCVYSQTLGVKWNFEGLLNALTTFSPPPDLLCLSLLLREAEFSFDFLKELQRADEELFKAANAASPDLDGASSAEATRLRRRSQILQQIQQRGIRTPRQTKPVAKKRKTAPASQAQQPPQASARAETASLGGGEEGEGEAEEGSRGQSAPETPSGAQRPSESRSPAAANGASEEADASGSVSPPREALDSRDAFLEVFALFRNSALEGTAPVEEASESDSRERRESLAFLALGKGPPLSESEAFGEENFAENGPPLLRKNAMDFDRWTEDDVDAGAGEEEGDEGCCVQRLLQRLLLLIGRKAGSPQQSLRTLRRYLDSRLDAEFAFSLLFLINPLEGVTRWTHLKPATRLRLLRLLLAAALNESSLVSKHVSLGGEEDALSFEGFVGDGPDGRLYWILGEEGDSASFKLYRENPRTLHFEVLCDDADGLEATASAMSSETGMEELSSLLLQHLQTMLIRQRQRSREQRRRKAVERQLEISLQNVVSGRRARKAVNYAEIGEIGGFEEEGQDPRTASLSAGVTREERMRARQERRAAELESEALIEEVPESETTEPEVKQSSEAAAGGGRRSEGSGDAERDDEEEGRPSDREASLPHLAMKKKRRSQQQAEKREEEGSEANPTERRASFPERSSDAGLGSEEGGAGSSARPSVSSTSKFLSSQTEQSAVCTAVARSAATEGNAAQKPPLAREASTPADPSQSAE